MLRMLVDEQDDVGVRRMIGLLDHQHAGLCRLIPGNLLHRFSARIFPVAGNQAGIVMQEAAHGNRAEQAAQRDAFGHVLRRVCGADDPPLVKGDICPAFQAKQISDLEIRLSDAIDPALMQTQTNPAIDPAVRREPADALHADAAVVLIHRPALTAFRRQNGYVIGKDKGVADV